MQEYSIELIAENQKATEKKDILKNPGAIRHPDKVGKLISHSLHG